MFTPPPPSADSPLSIATGTGSYFEYAVRKIIRNMFYHPIAHTHNGIRPLEQMFYYYHLQMMHIDMLWVNNYQSVNPGRIPSVFDLPSRSVRYFYNTDVRYNLGGETRTLDSHRLECYECMRQFNCNVDLLHNHQIAHYQPGVPFSRQTTESTRDVQLENFQRSVNLPNFRSTNEVSDMVNNRPLAQGENYYCQAPPVIYVPLTSSASSTTGFDFDAFDNANRYHHDDNSVDDNGNGIVRDELK